MARLAARSLALAPSTCFRTPRIRLWGFSRSLSRLGYTPTLAAHLLPLGELRLEALSLPSLGSGTDRTADPKMLTCTRTRRQPVPVVSGTGTHLAHVVDVQTRIF
ncbi:hypothetical protein BDN72DRAFT_554822 [Pluteus cervinus]|uniref:Uncharacterized protein n=1 Tax=Pluteus cervinus TaxID=181527 RepID=A0ACD3AXU9_9AGAR|nr:hypothetical protein BDN72DRAFT_554822 [Pluteus cervinus]